jgi:hypothetical protein
MGINHSAPVKPSTSYEGDKNQVRIQKAWVTRRARYGSIGRRNKDYRPRKNS